MRVLFSTTANDGHFGPMLPFARACVAAGHEVRVAAPVSFGDALARAGMVHEPFDDVQPEVAGPIMASLPDMTPEEADETVLREVFGRLDAQAALPRLIEIIDRWRPALIVRESAELGSLAAAARVGAPHVHLCIGMHEVAARFAESVREPMEELGALVGLRQFRMEAALAGETVLSVVPEELDAAGAALPPSAAAFRRFHEPSAPPDGSPALDWGDADAPLGGADREFPLGGADRGLPPGWVDRERPLVYVTFGTVAGSIPPFAGVFREALDALADVDARILMTVGRAVDPASLGPVPPNARVEQWLPQDMVLRHASAVIGHGGFGTTMGALAAGVPQVVAPLFSFDQAVNGEHVAAVGAGLTAGPGPGAVTRAAAELPRLLAEPGFAESARRMADALRALPPPSEAVAELVAVATGQ